MVFLMACFLQEFFPSPPAILFGKGSYSLCCIYWPYLGSIFSRGIVTDAHSSILLCGVKSSETDKKWKIFQTQGLEWGRTAQGIPVLPELDRSHQRSSPEAQRGIS